MPKHIVRTSLVVINGVDLSDHFRGFTVQFETDQVDLTALGDAMKVNDKGLSDGSMSGEAYQDYDVGEVDATLWPLATGNSSFVVAARPTNAAISATNPEYRMTAKLFGYTPMDGNVGEASMTPLTFNNFGAAGITRHTS